MKSTLYIAILLMGTYLHGQVTLIPDPEFEGLLIVQGIDTDGIINGQVLTEDIEDELILDIDDLPLLQDLTGIQDFTSLEHLYIFRSNVSEIDLSQNLNLIYLAIDDVSLESLDVSSNINLEELILVLDYSEGMFTSDLSYLGLSDLSSLNKVTIGYTKLASLDFSENVQLGHVILQFMPELFQVNLQNGNNTGLTILEITDNPILECIQVDDPAAVIAGNPPFNNWVIDNMAALSDDCFVLGNIDNYFDSYVVYPNPTHNLLTIQNQNGLDIESVSLYDTLGRKVLDHTEASESIDVSNLTAGIYFIHITTDQGLVTKKIIKE